MPTTMRAVRVHGWGEPPRLEEVLAPQPGDGETLVRVEAAAVAHLDRTVASGEFGMRPDLPYVGGVEGSGTVVSSAAHPEGTRVLVRGGGLGLTRNGTWAEYVTVPDAFAMPLPAGIGPELGASYFVPLTTAASALHAIGRLGGWSDDDGFGADQEVVIVAGAAGAVGSVTAQLAQRAGARVLGLVVDEEQAERLPEGIEPLVAGDAEALEALADERSATLLVDTLGGAGLATRMGWVRPGGRAVLVGYVTGEKATFDLPNWLLQDVALLPTNMIRRTRQARGVAAELAPLLATGEVRLEVESFALSEVARALELVGSGRIRGRAVLTPQER